MMPHGTDSPNSSAAVEQQLFSCPCPLAAAGATHAAGGRRQKGSRNSRAVTGLTVAGAPTFMVTHATADRSWPKRPAKSSYTMPLRHLPACFCELGSTNDGGRPGGSCSDSSAEPRAGTHASAAASKSSLQYLSVSRNTSVGSPCASKLTLGSDTPTSAPTAMLAPSIATLATPRPTMLARSCALAAATTSALGGNWCSRRSSQRSTQRMCTAAPVALSSRSCSASPGSSSPTFCSTDACSVSPRESRASSTT